MSEYRPWVPADEEADAAAEHDGAVSGAAGAGASGAESGYAPWTVTKAQVPAPKEKRFETPPGLGDPPLRRKGQNSHQTAAAALLWTGGFLLIGSIVFMAAMSLAIDLESIDMRHGGHDDPDDVTAMQRIRSYGGWGIAASLLFLVPGIGLLYDQPWARPVGFIAAAAAFLVAPLGPVFGIVSLLALSRMEAS